jgi:NADH-quinone oxidoreductase subunit G
MEITWNIKINGFNYAIKEDTSILDACKHVGITLPRFCYHESLSIAGNCRMCLVIAERAEPLKLTENDLPPKPTTACALPVDEELEDFEIFTETPYVRRAREGILETLLLNHPLDCPICDQGGECDLQDQTKQLGGDRSRFWWNKRGVEDKYFGPLIKTIMTRCIHCTRCVRYAAEIAGVETLGTFNRGTGTEIGSYANHVFNSEISGNIIDLCPVGALTSKHYSFKARPWELRSNESLDLTDNCGSSIYVNYKETEIARIIPKQNSNINDSIISDKARFSYDALNNQRLQRIFEFSSNKNVKVKQKDWSDLLTNIETLIQNPLEKITFMVNENLDLESLVLLKKFENIFSEKVKIRTVNSSQSYENSTVSELNDQLVEINKKESKTCFIISSNIKIENAIINAKLRKKYLDQPTTLYSFGQSFKSTFPMEFVNLNINNFFKTFEGKNLNLSNLIVKTSFPLFIISENLWKRFNGKNELIKIIKKVAPTSLVYNINKYSNLESNLFLGIKPLNKNDINESTTLFAIQLEDTVNFRKKILNSNKTLIFINSHGSNLTNKANIAIPCLTAFEEEGVYINLENRAQKALKVFSKVNDARSLKSIFLTLNKIFKSEINESKTLKHINEMIENSFLFNSNKKKFSTKYICNTYVKSSIFEFSLYPIKSSIEDFYRSNNFTKNSIIMNKCSQEMRNLTDNF